MITDVDLYIPLIKFICNFLFIETITVKMAVCSKLYMNLKFIPL